MPTIDLLRKTSVNYNSQTIGVLPIASGKDDTGPGNQKTFLSAVDWQW